MGRPRQHFVQQRGLQPLVIRGRPVESATLAQQGAHGPCPLLGPLQAVREQPGQPVELDLGGVGAVLAEGGIGDGADQETEGGEVGPFLASRVGEELADAGGSHGRGPRR
jgi:hypothetical protein